MNDNDLRIIAYSSGTIIDTEITTFIKPHNGLRFETIYPGGLYSICSFFVPGDPTLPHPSFDNSTKRIEVVNGIKVIWEGQFDIVSPIIQPGNNGWQFSCTGYWGAFLGRNSWNKIWCDNRITQDKWVWQDLGGTVTNQFHKDNYNHLYMYPGVASFAATDYAAFRYTMPTGQTIPGITYAYDFDEGAQQWSMSAYDVTGGTVISEVDATGNGLMALTPGVGCKDIELRFNSKAVQSVANYDSGIYGKFSNIKVYGEIESINPTEIIKDIVGTYSSGDYSNINTDTSHIDSNGLVLEPCFMEWEATTDFMAKLASYGDTSYNSWATGMLESAIARIPDGRPIIYYQQYPTMTGYDYVIRMEETEGGVMLDRVMDEISNFLIIEYTGVNGENIIKSGSDDATLKNAASAASYGWRTKRLSLGNTGETEALNYARRYLAWFKDPKWRMSSPITIRGRIRTQSRNYVPVSWVRAGQRIMIENYLQEWDGSGLIFLITNTSYDEDAETLSITAGTPDPLATLVARMRK